MFASLIVLALAASQQSSGIGVVRRYHDLLLSGRVAKAQAMIAQDATVRISRRGEPMLAADARMVAEFLKGCVVKEMGSGGTDDPKLGERVWVTWHCPVPPEQDTFVSSLGVKDGEITIDLNLYHPPLVSRAPASN